MQDMTIEEINEKIKVLSKERDELLDELHSYSAERNRREAIQAAQNTVNSLNEKELDALKNIIGASSVQPSTHIGENGGATSSIRT